MRYPADPIGPSQRRNRRCWRGNSIRGGGCKVLRDMAATYSVWMKLYVRMEGKVGTNGPK